MSPVFGSFVFLFVFVSSAFAFSCETNKFQNWGTKLLVQLDCKEKANDFDSCCRTHDRCYEIQGGRSSCDNNFCSCLDNVARGTRCGLNAKTFCNAVKTFGAKAYENAGKNG